MFKKLTAGVVVVSILSMGSMALANTPQRNRPDLALKRVRPAQAVKVANDGPTVDTSKLDRIILRAKTKEAQPRLKALKQVDESERLQNRADFFGIDITGLSVEEAKAKILETMEERRSDKVLEKLQQRADFLGVDITGLSIEEARAKIREAMEEQKTAITLERLQKRADLLGIDITGLSIEEARAKILEAMKEIKR